MQNKKNVAVVIFSRANYARIKSVLLELKKRKKVNLQIIIGASAVLDKYGNLEPILKRDKLKITAKSYNIIEGETPVTMAKSAGLGIIELTNIFMNLKPDIVVTIADRFETIATAIAGSYMNIPVAHTQGGEVTGSIDESVRHAVTKFSHIHFPATKKSYNRIIKLGELKKNVHYVGCPSIDLIDQKKLKLDGKFFKNWKLPVGFNINFKEKYLVVLQHPVTTEYHLEKNRTNSILEAINELKIQTVWLWPNVDAGSDIVSKTIRIFKEKNPKSKISFVKNLPPEEFLKLINNSECFIGNSSSAVREGSFIGIPAVSIGNRQLVREHGNNIVFCGYKKSSIKKKILLQIKKKNRIKRSKLFGDGNAGKKIAKILESTKVKIQKKISY
tara:strand:+ start:531 stop:1691 length:1161 start_codon:yes stop_codon:yes gene_type:complete